MGPRRNTAAAMTLLSSDHFVAASQLDIGCADLLEKALQLAYFIVQDRSVAIELIHRSFTKLKAQQSREKRRFYWRYKHTTLRTRKLNRARQDVLQWLIYVESERYEKEQQQQRLLLPRSLAVQYIKSIIQMTGNMSSFYVAVGLYRILHNYSTRDLQSAYERVTADFAGPEKYRRVKKALMQKLATRFCGLINISQSDSQELRFEVDDNQDAWAELVSVCLDMFTPWSTGNSCTLGMPFWKQGPGTTRNGRMPAAADIEETNRCHVFMHPPCFDQLATRLGLNPRSAKLSMPRFTINHYGDFADRSSRRADSTPPLTAEERATLARGLGTSETHSPGQAPKLLSILADGELRAQWDLAQETCKELKVDEGTRLLEFWGEDGRTGQLLATHCIDYTAVDGIAAGEHTVALGDKDELLLKTVPACPESPEAGGATILMELRLASPLVRLRVRLYSFLMSPRLLGYALPPALVLVCCLWLMQGYRQELSRQRSIIAQLRSDRDASEAALHAMKPQPTPTIGSTVTYSLTPDFLAKRGAGGPEAPVVAFSPETNLVQFELPLYSSHRNTVYRATLHLFSSKKELLQENLLQAQQTRAGAAVIFALPSVLIKEQGHYVITLESMSAHPPQRVGDFSFYVQR
jgi:hypothetical protein